MNFKKEERDDVFLIFSAHSLPMKVVNRGDSYPLEVSATVSAVMERLNMQYTLAWQSKVGPAQWLRPSTMETIVGLGNKGRKNLLLIPIAFTSDHIETLYEYDIQYAEVAKKNNIKLTRVNSLNDHPLFINALVKIVKLHIDNPKSTLQFCERCYGCDNEYCKLSKEYFSKNN